MDGAADTAKVAKKGISERQKIIISLGTAIFFICWHLHPKAFEWWDRKGFEAVVEKTLSARGIATAEDTPQTSIEESGRGLFNGRNLQATVVKVTFVQVDKQAGVKTPRCIFMYSLIDKEFDVYRNMSLSDCDEPKALANWKSAVKFR